MAKQKSQFLPIRWDAAGKGMDSDTTPLAIKNYIDALNIHFQTQLGSTTVAIENSLGNTEAFTLPVVIAQNKVFQIYVQWFANTDPTVSLQFFNGTGASLGTATYQPITNLTDTYNAAVSAINTILGAGNVIIDSLTVVTTNTGYFTMQFQGGTSVSTWDYSLIQTTTGTTTQPIIVAEAIDASLAGFLRFIGSYDLNGDGIIWSTPQTQLPSTLSITNFATGAGGTIEVTVADTISILDGAAVTIENAVKNGVPYPAANGTWIVSLINNTRFDLLGTTGGASQAGTGTVNVNVNGVGEIGAATFDLNSSTWNYTTILRSREWNFNTQKQIKCVCERNIYSANIYWTDNYNPYRRLYFQGAYDAPNAGGSNALNFNNPQNIYFYGEIDLETRLFQGNGLADILYYNQLQSGGALFAGNWRYIIRFLDEDFNPTLWTDPSGIFVVSANQLTPNTEVVAEQVYGNSNATQSYTTGKINELLLSGIIPNLFKYVELGALQYVDGTTVPIANIVNRILLAQTTTQVIQHTGNEVNVQTLDINTLVETQPDIAKGLGIDIIDNRLIPSNTSGSADIDFTAWIQSMTYNLVMDSISGLGSRELGTLQVGEYEIPYNTFNKLGFMLNETYRFSAKLELINGAFTENFWFSDITFNTASTSSDGKRTGGLPFMDLTDSLAQTVYVPIVNITNINWNFTINGIPVSKIVKRIHWEIVEMTEQFREVLASGMAAMGVSFNLVSGLHQIEIVSDNPYTNNFQFYFATGNDATQQNITDYIFISGAFIKSANPDYPYINTAFDGGTTDQVERKFMSFYSPDCLLNQASINWESGDQLMVFGMPNITENRSAANPSAGGYNYPFILNANREFSGYVDSAMYPNVLQSIAQVQNIGAGFDAPFTSIPNRFYNKSLFCFGVSPSPLKSFNFTMLNQGSPVINTVNFVIPTNLASGVPDYGFYMVQYFRAKTNKFGDITQSKYIPTGAITENLAIDTLMYGDTFNQKTWIKQRYTYAFDNSAAVVNTFNGLQFDLSGFGHGMAFYSQNRANSQMISRGDSSYLWKYPSISLEDWLNANEVNFNTGTLLIYNSGYNSQQNVTNDVAFDPNLPNNPNTPARWWWSLNKPEDSVSDQYTIILPLNFRDEDLTDGDIWHTIVANSELFTIQQRALIRQYVEDTSMVQSSEATIVMGSSGVGQQRGNKQSGFGTIHGFGVIKGKSQGGKDTFYYIDTYECKIMRFEPSDGSKCLSDAHNMRWFFNNYLNFTNDALTPANGQGICGVWDEQHSEAVWTVRAKKQVGIYSPTSLYFANDEVSYIPSTTLSYSSEPSGALIDNEPIVFGKNGTGFVGHDTGTGKITVYNLNQTPQTGQTVTGQTSAHSFVITGVTPPVYSTFEQTGEIYIAITNSVGLPPDLRPDAWQIVPHFGSTPLVNGKAPYQYYNEYTIAYNEVKDKFVTRYSFLPMLYIQIGSDFLSPRPVNQLYIAYWHYSPFSLYCVWYSTGGGAQPLNQQVENGFIAGMIVNYDVNLDKRALAIEILTNTAPYQLQLSSKQYTAGLLQAANFQKRGDFWVAAIPDSSNNSRIYGSWFSITLTFVAQQYQNFYNLILKTVIKNRTWKS